MYSALQEHLLNFSILFLALDLHSMYLKVQNNFIVI